MWLSEKRGCPVDERSRTEGLPSGYAWCECGCNEFGPATYRHVAVSAGRSRTPSRDLGYVVLSGLDFVDFMRRAAAGESPDLLYAEFYVNSDINPVEDQ